jgi:type VI secretion system protein ImpL
MSAVRRLFGNWWFLSGLTALVFVILFAFVLPALFLFFYPIWIRLLFVFLVVAVWAGLAVWHVLAARRAADRLAA